MHKLTIKELYIFSIKEKRAKYVDFSERINVITSSKVNGTKKGKSAIMKSIYHTLGADCFFEDKWNINDKVNIMKVDIDKTDYFILRYQRLFKLYFAENLKEIFRTCNRGELSEKLGEIFGFKVMLPNKETGNIEVAPPAFNYLLNYIDQDGMDGSKFLSFSSLQQYSDYKDKVLYYHFGIYTEEYYNIVKKIEELEEQIQTFSEKEKVCKNMMLRINCELNDNDYSTDLKALKEDLEIHKQEYLKYRNTLVKCKKKLMKYRNIREDLLKSISEISAFNKEIGSDINKVLKHECPYCHSEIKDNVEYRIYNYNCIEDALFMKAELEENLTDIERKISIEENKYIEQLHVMKLYEKRLDSYDSEIDDVLKYKGYLEMRDSLVKEISEIVAEIGKNEDLLKKEKSKKKKYDMDKKKVNDKYYSLIE